MPNARDAATETRHRILVLGDTGSGKTTQFRTLPGKKFAYLFDPNALLSLQGSDIEYQEFLPDVMPMSVRSLKHAEGAKEAKGDRSPVTSSDLYLQWETDFNKRLKDGFFDAFDWIAFDSATTLLDLIMDRVLTINGRFGQWPLQDDYGPQMITFMNICRTITGLGKNVYMTGHLDLRQDELTKRVFRRPMMTGRLVSKVPLLFSDVLVLEAENDGKGSVIYKIQTVPDRMTTNVRTSIRGLDPFETATIDWDKPIEGQGLGGILNWHKRRSLQEGTAEKATGTR